MNINFEFLDEDPLDNVITCMHYRFDKVIYFGYKMVRERWQKILTVFLTERLSVEKENIVFVDVSQKKLENTLALMRETVMHEKKPGNRLFFDITGGEELVLLAFGMLAKESDASIHRYDIRARRMHVLNPADAPSVNETPGLRREGKDRFHLDVESYFQLYGGRLKYGTATRRKQSQIRHVQNAEFDKMIPEIWAVAHQYKDDWTQFATFMRHQKMTVTDSALSRTVRIDSIFPYTTNREPVTPLSLNKVKSIMTDCREHGLLSAFHARDGELHYAFSNKFVRDCVHNDGSILELYAIHREKLNSDDCMVGVDFLWDDNRDGRFTHNEIDVVSIKDNIPSFISCKMGKVDKSVLYELDAVVTRFCGKYAKKKLIASKEMDTKYKEAFLRRADDMDIEVQTEI